MSPDSSTMLKTTNVKFSFIEVWFTDPSNKPLETEGNVNLIINIGIS